MRPWSISGRALLCGVTLAGGLTTSALADTPAAITLSALALQEGWNPDQGDPPNMARAIPRDFPVPVASHHLKASNAFPAASVTGTPEQAEAFYNTVLLAQGWQVKKRVKFPGKIAIVACKTGQCVNVSCSSPQVDPSNPNIIRLLFFKE